MKSILSLCLCTGLYYLSLAQSSPVIDFPEDTFIIQATYVDIPPKIDGQLDDEAWMNIQPISHFTQIWPDEGNQPTEKSEVKVAYDKKYLYFAFKFYDENPELIRAMNLERGGRNDRDDHAYIGLDTYLDKRNAYLFEMNSLGTQDDATITDERLTIDGFSWDAVFYSETVIDHEGWSLEVSIPFRQLRFPKKDELEFGLLLSRMINRKNERVMWPAIGLDYGNYAAGFGALAAASQYGKLTGLKDIQPGLNLETRPFLTAGVSRIRDDLASKETTTDHNVDVGLDIKYAVTSNMTLDLTVNTDFAQVEADNVQVNLTRFNLFFPEKREFFLERSGLFDHGNLRSTQTFFSRRIGLTNQILAGARMTGQVGPLSIGFLNIETGEKIKEIFGPLSSNNLVARVRGTVFPRATVGAIFTNKQQAEVYNRAIGLDTRIRFWSSSEFNAWFTQTIDADESLNDRAGHISLDLQNDKYTAGVSYTDIGATYNPALGFVRRRDIKQYTGELSQRTFVEWEKIKFRRFTFQASYDYIANQANRKQSTEAEFQVVGEFDKRDQVSISVQNRGEILDFPFDIRPDVSIPTGNYSFTQLTFSGSTDQSRRASGRINIGFGQFFHGSQTSLRSSFGFRQSKHLTLEADILYNIINLPEENGEFDATTISLSILGAVNKDLFAKALIQYDNFTRRAQANIRVDWIHTPGSDLFLVYNTAYFIPGISDVIFDPRRDIILQEQTAIMKLTYLKLI